MTDAPIGPRPPSDVDGRRGPSSQTDGGKQMALVVYILYFIGFATGFTAAAGVIIAYMNAAEASQIYRTHFEFQIRTFWLGLLTLIVGWILVFVLIGYLVFAWFAIWTLIRCVKGTMRLTNDQPIEDPKTLLW